MPKYLTRCVSWPVSRVCSYAPREPTLAAFKQLATSGFLHPGERVVLFNTGSGLKYSNLVQGEFPVIDPGDTAAIDAL